MLLNKFQTEMAEVALSFKANHLVRSLDESLFATSDSNTAAAADQDRQIATADLQRRLERSTIETEAKIVREVGRSGFSLPFVYTGLFLALVMVWACLNSLAQLQNELALITFDELKC